MTSIETLRNAVTVAPVALENGVEIRHRLETLGFVVVGPVLTPRECEQLASEVWDCVEKASPELDRADPTTWKSDKMPFGSRGVKPVGSPFQHPTLKVRTHPAVHELHRKALGLVPGTEMLSSMDSIGFVPDTVMMKKDKEANLTKSIHNPDLWLHWDKCPNDSGRVPERSLQSLVDLTGSEADDATFVVVPYSHMYFDEMARKSRGDPEIKKIKLQDYFPLYTNPRWLDLLQQTAAEKGYPCDPLRVPIPKGCFVMWNHSVHCNSKRLDTNTRPPKARIVIMTCLTPREDATAHELARSRWFFANRVTTTHSPRYFRRTSTSETRYGKSVVGFEIPEHLPVDIFNTSNQAAYRTFGFDSGAHYLSLLKSLRESDAPPSKIPKSGRTPSIEDLTKRRQKRLVALKARKAKKAELCTLLGK